MDEEAPQAAPVKESVQSRQQCPIGWSERRAGHLPTQDGNLVAENDDFDRQFIAVASR
jgi:hypothetical protein